MLQTYPGKEPKPTPSPDDSDEESASVTSWDTRHALAREALVRSLEPSDLIKVISVKDSAPAIRKHLKDKYSKSLDFEYIRVNSEFQALRKDSKTSMNDHINKFNNLLQLVDYNRPKEIPESTKASTNLNFLQSLGKDWEIWGLAKGKLIRSQPTAELMAEVRALAMRGNTASQAETATSEQSQEVKALVSRFDGGSQFRDGNRKWKRNRKGGGKNNGKPYQGGKMEATTEARIVVEGHPSIHTNSVSLIKRKDTMSLSAEKLHETKMATTATTMAMEMEMATASLGRLDQRLISRSSLNILSLTLRTQ